MRNLISYFIKNEIAANLLMVGLLLLGFLSLGQMKSTFFPEVEQRNISIQITYPGASPQEIEEGVVMKIEENLKGLTGVERYTSVSQENAGTVTIEVLRDYDPELILQEVKNAVDRIPSFPVGMEPLVVFKPEQISNAITFALTGSEDLKVLKRFGRQVEDELRLIDGISQIELVGFPEEEIEISINEEALEAYGLTFAEVNTAVQSANLKITGGTLKGTEEELLIRADNKSYQAEGFTSIVVKTAVDGSVIYLYQVAEIKDKWSDNPNRSFVNGEIAVVVNVKHTIEEDILSITDDVKKYIEDFNDRGYAIKASLLRDRSVVLRQRIDLLTENGIIGFVIVLMLLAMFLNWRVAFWVALAIPISFAGMFILANIFDVTINVISLFGMILVIGILVDDGIVIGENIYQQYERGVPRFQAALNGTMQVLPAVFTAIFTTVVAFMSFFYIEGTLGDFFSQMALVVILSLVFSLVEGAFILPAHMAHSKALETNKKKNVVTQRLEDFMNWMRDKLYSPVLRFGMRHNLLTLSILIGLMFITIGAINMGVIRTTFFPVIDRDYVDVNIQMPAGTRETITTKWLVHIEEAAWRANDKLSKEFFDGAMPAIENVQLNIGPGTNTGSLSIAVLDSEKREPLEIQDVVNAIREEAGPIPEADLLSYGVSSIFGKPVSLSLIGSNIPQLQAAAEDVKAAMRNLAALTDVVDSNQEGLREIDVSLTDKGRFLGIDLRQVVTQIRSAFFGSEVQRLQRGRDEVRVWVRYSEENRRSLEQLKQMRIRTLDGKEYPLAEIAKLDIARGITSINHIDGKREIRVDADIANRNVSVSDLTASLRNEIVPQILASYPEVQANYEGQNRQQAKTQRSLRLVMPIVALIMFFSIALTFRSISQTIAVFALIPFGFIGAAWGHAFMDLPVSLFSSLGLIALVGILVNDALVFVTSYNEYIRDGIGHMRAIYRTGMSRFRPIVLTSLTTVAGLMPLLFETSVQARFLIPMAISVAFGLMLVTAIILVLLPILLILINRLKRGTHWVWDGKVPATNSVEPATVGYHSSFLMYLIAGLLALAVIAVLIFAMLKVTAFMA